MSGPTLLPSSDPANGPVPHREIPSPVVGRPRFSFGRLIAYLRARPVLCLLIMSPGIVEYLSTSSSLTGLVIAPPVFFIFLALNLGLYGPGVLLIREAMVRWRKGWPTVILLAAAYAILEEGIALSTLYNPHASVVGSLGFYGHWMGVSWVWLVGVVMVHILYSISLPILLLGLTLPETRGKSLVSNRQMVYLLVILAVDVVVLMAIVTLGIHFWMGAPVLVGSLLAIGALVLLGRRAPADLFRRTERAPTRSPVAFALMGGSLFIGTLLIEGILGSAHIAAPLTMLATIVFYVVIFVLALRSIGTRANERHLVAFATGAIGFLAVFGFLAALPLPVVGFADILLVIFLRWLWRKYPAVPVGWAAPVAGLPLA